MLKAEIKIIKFGDEIHQESLNGALNALPDGDYSILIFDQQKNKALNQLKYLFGIVLKAISKELPEHPDVDALYRYFEEMFAPIYYVKISGENGEYSYYNLKGEKQQVLSRVTEQIINYALSEWGIKVLTRENISSPEAKALYAGAYSEQWKDVLD